MKDYVLQIENLRYGYPDGTLALRDINLGFVQGSKIAILGPNGAGKSTLFMHLIGLFQPQHGCVRFKGTPVSYKKSDLKQLRQRVGIVFQDPDAQLFSSNVWQEVSFGPLNLDLPEEEVSLRVQRAMELTDIVALQERPVHALSYGQKKRVAIAGVLAMEPEVLIVDEPTVWLDQQHSQQVMEIFSKLNSDQGKTIILSTHDVDLAYSWADYIFVLQEGQVVGQGTPMQIFTDFPLLNSTSLSVPWLVQVYQEMRAKGWIAGDTPMPENAEALFRLMPTRQ